MDKLHKGLAIALLIAIAVIFLQKCGSDCPELIVGKKEIVSHVIHYDTVLVEIETPVYRYFKVPVPTPYRDTVTFLSFMDEDFDDLPLDIMIYEDSVKDDTVTIYYRLKVRGVLDQIGIGYGLHKSYLITKTETIETEVTKRIKHKLGIYAGLDVGGNLNELNHFTPIIELSTWKWNYNVGYNLMNKSVIIGARIRIGKKRSIKLAGI